LATVPADADAVADAPASHVGPDGIDTTDDLVTRHPRQLDSREQRQLGERVAVADPTGLDPDADLARTRVGNRTLDDLEWPVGTRDLCDSHRAHD
jgi:hypothetical protein